VPYRTASDPKDKDIEVSSPFCFVENLAFYFQDVKI
jgi:hypothetical protein